MRWLTILRLTVLLAVLLGAASYQLGAAEDGNEAQPTPGWEEKIRRALDKPISIEFEEVPLADVMAFIRQQAGTPNVLIDIQSLDDVGVSSDAPITRNVKGITLRSALRLILRDLDLTYVLRDGALVIMTPEEAESRLITRVFEVLDLIRPDADTPPEEYDYAPVINLITSIVAPTAWVDAGGSGSIDGYRGTLVVSQTEDVLDEMSDLLTTLRKGRQIVREHGTSAPPVTSLRVFPQDARYEAALDRPGNCEFINTRLCDVVDFVKSTWGIEVQIDTRALEDVGIGDDTPITFSAKDLALRHALRHILKQLDLTFVLRHEVLLITTPEEGEATLELRVYPVGDLVSGAASLAPHDGVSSHRIDYNSLIGLTISSIAPVTWGSAGGPGSIEAAPSCGLLVVSQTGDVHREIEKLFAKLREKIPAKTIAGQQQEHDGLRLVIYFVTTKPVIESMNGRQPASAGQDQSSLKRGTPALAQMGGMGGGATTATAYLEDQELLELIKELVEPESWKEDGVYATAAAGRLVIRQTDPVHRKIRRMLVQLEVDFDDSQQLQEFTSRHFSGGMGGLGGGGMF